MTRGWLIDIEAINRDRNLRRNVNWFRNNLLAWAKHLRNNSFGCLEISGICVWFVWLNGEKITMMS